MILATTTVENVDRFLGVFGTKVADKRALYGSKGATLFRDPTEENRVWGLFDMDEAGVREVRLRPRGPRVSQGSWSPRQARGRGTAWLLPGVIRSTHDDHQSFGASALTAAHMPEIASRQIIGSGAPSVGLCFRAARASPTDLIWIATLSSFASTSEHCDNTVFVVVSRYVTILSVR
jgi:hypothetical protein